MGEDGWWGKEAWWLVEGASQRLQSWLLCACVPRQPKEIPELSLSRKLDELFDDAAVCHFYMEHIVEVGSNTQRNKHTLMKWSWYHRFSPWAPCKAIHSRICSEGSAAVTTVPDEGVSAEMEQFLSPALQPSVSPSVEFSQSLAGHVRLSTTPLQVL